MLNKNIKLKKFNKLLLSINRLIESFFSNIHNFIKEFKKKNSKFRKFDNKIFITFGSIFILILVYFLMPTFYDKNLVKIKLKNQINNKYNLKVNITDEISYALFPTPHFFTDNLNIYHNDKILINSKDTRIYISAKNLFSFKKLKIKNINFEQNEFNIKRENLPFFINILNSNISDYKIVFKNSIIFYKDNSDDVIFLIDLKNLKFFYDLEKKHQLIANYKIFNLPFKFYLNHNNETNSFEFDLESKNIRTKIKNFSNYIDKKLNGNLETRILNDINNFAYVIENNTFSLKSKDGNFKGNIDLKPFYLSSELNFNQFDIKNFLKENSIFINLINSEIFHNPNINADLDININEIKNFKYLENIKIKTIFEEGNIHLKDINTNWNNSVMVRIEDTQLLNDFNKVNLIGSIIFEFNDLNKFYRYYQINKDHRNEIKKIKFDFFLNLDDKLIKISNAQIDNLTNNNVNNFLESLNLEKKNFFNKVIFRGFVKNFFKYYHEG